MGLYPRGLDSLDIPGYSWLFTVIPGFVLLLDPPVNINKPRPRSRGNGHNWLKHTFLSPEVR